MYAVHIIFVLVSIFSVLVNSHKLVFTYFLFEGLDIDFRLSYYCNPDVLFVVRPVSVSPE